MAIVQATSLKTAGSAASATSAPMGASTTVGDLFVLLTANSGYTSVTEGSPSDSKTNTWTPISTEPLYVGVGGGLGIFAIYGWTAPVVTGNSGAGHTFTVPIVGGPWLLGGVCVELSGRNNTTPITLAMSSYSQTGSLEIQPGTPTSGSDSIIVTSGAAAGADLLNFNVLNSGSTAGGIVYTAGSGGWSIPSGAQVNAGGTTCVACMLQTLAGAAPATYNASFTLNEYDATLGIILAINAAPAGGGGGGAVKNFAMMGVG